MFEVGKKYKSDYSHLIFTCVHVGKKNVYCESLEGDPLLLHKAGYSWIKEYKEPIIHTRYGLWYKHNPSKETGFVMAGSRVSNEKDVTDWFSSAYPSHILLRVVKLTFTENE